MPHKPRPDALLVEPAETLEPRHAVADLKLLETDRALGIGRAVLGRRLVGEHARVAVDGHGARRRRRERRRPRRAGRVDGRRRAVGARHAVAAACRRGLRRRSRTARRGRGRARGAVAPASAVVAHHVLAVQRDALFNVVLAQKLPVVEGALGQLEVAHGALVLLGDLVAGLLLAAGRRAGLISVAARVMLGQASIVLVPAARRRHGASARAVADGVPPVSGDA